MTKPIAYDNIVLHCEKGDKSAQNLRRILEDMDVPFTNLEHVDATQDLEAISTWFKDKDGKEIIFRKTPVVTYEIVLWEDDDDKYVKQNFALSPEGFPSDFASLARSTE